MRLIECDESGATLELDAGACWLEPRTGKVCAPGLRAELLPDWSGALPVAVAVLAVPPWARAELGVEPGDLVLRGHIGLRSSQKPLPPSTGRISYQGWIRGQHVCYVTLCPFAYDPRSRELKAYSSLRARVHFLREEDCSSRRAAEDPYPFERLLDGVLLNPGQAKRWRAGPPAVTAAPRRSPSTGGDYKIMLDEAGICCMTREYLLEHNVPVTGADPRTFRAFSRGCEVALYVEGEEDGVFDPGDCIKFWSDPHYRDEPDGREVPVGGKYTETNVYWLSWGDTLGLRMVARDVGPSPSATHATCYWCTRHIEQDHNPFVPDEEAMSGDRYGDEWFWEELRSGTLLDIGVYPFWLHAPALQQAQGDSCHVRVALTGLTDIETLLTDHQAILRLNGHWLTTALWGEESQDYLLDTRGQEPWQVPVSWLLEGQNWFEVELPGIPFPGVYDAVYVDWFELDFWRRYVAVDDTLRFASPGRQDPDLYRYSVEGFDHSSLELYELNGGTTGRLTGFNVEQRPGGFALEFADSSRDGREYYAVATGRHVTPTNVVRDESYEFPQAGSYAIITHQDFLGPAETLLQAWEAAEPGLAGAIVPVQEIYDAFWWGIFDPRAIRRFLTWAYGTWDPAPAHVLLLGDATWDYKLLADESDPTHRNFVPSWGNPAWDDYFALVDGDDLLPDLVLGRLAVENAETAATVVGKLSSYLGGTATGSWQEHALMVADYYSDQHPWGFREQCEALIDSFVLLEPAFFLPETVYKDDGSYYPPGEGSPEADSVVAIVNRGCALTNYVGHGGTWCWGTMFWGSDVQDRLTNRDMLPVTLSWTCHTGRFANPSIDSFAEEWLWKQGGGAVGFVGTTGWGHTGYDYFQMWHLFAELLQRENRRVGEALLFSKVAFADTTLLGADPEALEQRRESPLYFTLLGDPRLKIRLGARPDLALDSLDITLDPPEPIQGQTVLVTATIDNRGPDPVSNAAIGFWEGEMSPGSSIDEVVLTSVGAGHSAHASVHWNTEALVGMQRLLVMADPDSLITEGREWNNEAARWVEVLPSKPDVMITSSDLRFEPAVPDPADSIVQIFGRVHNVGTAPAEAFVVEFRGGSQSAPGELLGTVPVEQLVARDSVEVSHPWPIDDTMAGPHIIWCILDPHNQLDELDEQNNSAWAPIEILTRVELAITSEDIFFSNTHPPEGDPLRIELLVHNHGEERADAVGTEVFVDEHPDSTGSEPFAFLQIDSIPGRAVGRTRTQWPTIGEAGRHTIYVVVDPQNRYVELDEDNNRTSRAVEVLALADLMVSTVSSDPVVPVEAEMVTIEAIVRNGGMIVAPPFAVEFFLGEPEQGTLLSLWDGVELAETSSVTLGAQWLGVAGEHQIWVRLDGTGSVDESNEENNTAPLHLNVLTMPDLTVGGQGPSDTLVTGDTLWVQGSVQNEGEASAEDVSVGLLWEESPSAWSLISSVSLEMIGGGETAETVLPWPVIAGQHHLAIAVSCGSVEADTTNNTWDLWVVARERKGADVYLTGHFAPEIVVEGDSAFFEGSVGNKGEEGAHQVVLSIWERGLVRQAQLGGIDPGLEVLTRLGWSPTPGVHSYVAHATHAGSDTDTTNNLVTGCVTVRAKPDLRCAWTQITPGSVVEGDTLLIEAGIANEGELAATEFAVGAMVDERFITLVEVPGLEGGRETSVSFHWYTVGEAGERVLTVWVDPDTRIDEGCETNNLRSETVPVTPDTIGPRLESVVRGVEGFRTGDPLWAGTLVEFIARDCGTGIDTSSIQITLDGRRLRPGDDYALVGLGREVAVVLEVSSQPGIHEVVVTALADRAHNPCPDVPLHLSYQACTSLEISQFMAHPNPTTGPTQFLCLYPPVDADQIRVDIFSLSGRLIRRLRDQVGPGRFHWDAKDEDGEAVSNGVYVARLVLCCSQGKATRLTRVAVIR